MKTPIPILLSYTLMILAVSIGSLLLGRSSLDQLASDEDVAEHPTQSKDEEISVEPPPFSEGVFPCSECHFEDDEIDTTPREVDFHDTVTFEHDAENRWCLDCHDAQHRDNLHLADGTLISFQESPKLCGQCHSPQYKSWKVGDHGKRTGNWDGKKQYLLCAHCHDPHSPSIKPIEPLDPPIRQEEIK